MKWLLTALDTMIELVQSLPPQERRRERRLEEFRRSIMRLRNVDEGLTEILSFSSELFGTPHVGILIWDEEQGQFVNRCNVPGLRSSWNVYDPFFVTITEYDRVLTVRDAAAMTDEHDRQVLLRFFEDTKASLLLPLILNETVLAVLFIGPCKVPDLSLVEDFRAYAVLALSNSIIYTRVESLLVSLEDKVSERTRQLEEATNQMIQSEKMATLGVMVAGVAHELNTPSGVILNASENLFERLDSFFERLAFQEWLVDPDLVNRFLDMVRFFHFHMLTGNPSMPSSAFQLRRRLKQSFEELSIDSSGELASFFIDHGFIGKLEEASTEHIAERLRSDSLFSQIVSLYRGIDEDARKHYLGYLHDIAGIYRNVRNITSSATSIARLVKALRIYSRSGAGDFVSASIEELLDATLELMGSIWKKGIRIERRFGGVPDIECDPDRLNQVWSNLLVNAYQAVRDRPDPLIVISTESMKDAVRVSIRDNGPGIPEAACEKIWDPFFTTKEQGEGTGLGLSIVRRIVEEHGGLIDFSTGENGTEFRVELPLKKANRQQILRHPPGPGRYDWR